ncbi:putative potassium channel beta subunit protein [Halorhabdus tiamatea SARL4B]|uniref:NADP-dependent aldo/keto reductase domain protein n=1 Tax=Halorhabdus tiamatea SARL4B TaxID=1033806 RepID=F7PJJ2_9EURY|nr:putative potassium channel beta subunit protein [Halorhabdus tiamatea SARL4B]CCQ34252.1 NADP-dependent aldo/keto reductase domain protein [Halorhabdus tiamatea SARL4B]
MTMAQMALRWILGHDAVSTVIPEATSPEHIRDNVEAAEMDPLSHEAHGAVRDIYEEFVSEMSTTAGEGWADSVGSSGLAVASSVQRVNRI